MKMSCTILYPLLLLLFSCATLSEVQQKEKGVQAEVTEHLNVKESSALLAFGEFQPHIFTWIQSELAELKSTTSCLKNTLQVTEEQLEQLKRKGNLLSVLISQNEKKNEKKKMLVTYLCFLYSPPLHCLTADYTYGRVSYFSNKVIRTCL